MRPRISVMGAVVLIAASGLWMGALVSSSTGWTSIAATSTLAALLTGVLGALFTLGPERAAWTGFALFGWVYLVLVDWDWIGGPLGHDLAGGLTDLAEWVFPPAPQATATTGAAAGGRANAVSFEVIRLRAIRVGNFVQIGRMTLALLFALAGAWVGHAFASRSTSGDDRR